MDSQTERPYDSRVTEEQPNNSDINSKTSVNINPKNLTGVQVKQEPDDDQTDRENKNEDSNDVRFQDNRQDTHTRFSQILNSPGIGLESLNSACNVKSEVHTGSMNLDNVCNIIKASNLASNCMVVQDNVTKQALTRTVNSDRISTAGNEIQVKSEPKEGNPLMDGSCCMNDQGGQESNSLKQKQNAESGESSVTVSGFYLNKFYSADKHLNNIRSANSSFDKVVESPDSFIRKEGMDEQITVLNAMAQQHYVTDFKKSDLDEGNSKSYWCKDCGAGFTQQGNLTRHMKTHTNGDKFKCTICDAEFSQSCRLKKHMKIHTGDRPYKCTLCELAFTRSSHLKRHMVIHTGEKPYNCWACGATFTQAESVKIHMRLHTGERPYKCKLCDAEFTQTGHLSQHMKTHTGEKEHKCEFCDAVFNHQSSMLRHMQTHLN